MDRPGIASSALLGPLLLCKALAVYEVIALQHLPRVKEYEVVYPQKLFTRQRRNAEAKFPDEVQYGFEVQGEDVVMHLERNENLFAQNYTQTHYSRHGYPITTSPVILDHCYYHGYIKNESDSEASISLCKGVRGYFKTKGRRYLIEPLLEGEKHAVFKYESLESSNKTCGVTHTNMWRGIPFLPQHRYTTDEKLTYLRAKKYIEVYIVADKSMYNKYGKHIENVRKRIFEITNFINLVYKSINTFVALIGTEIWDAADQVEVNSKAGATLDRFAHWRQQNLLRRIRNDNAQLLTNTRFENGTVGLAYIGIMCSTEYSAGINQDHGEAIPVGATVAHEMGHNIGMQHDSLQCVCADPTCIMEASQSTHRIPKRFSSCSLKAFQDFVLSRMPLCLKNKPLAKDLQSPAVCGNGFTEIGEDCDCGTPQECQNPCCEAAKCKMKLQAMCAEGDCCENCQMKKHGVVCRPSKDDCDLPDTCDGKTAICPSDRFRMNGSPCNNDEGYCYYGTCPTLLGQCKDFWGESVRLSSDYCFQRNKKGVSHGYCTYSGDVYIACKQKDIKCGKLYCTGGSLEPSVFASTVSFTICKTIIPTKGYVPNFGITKNGTKCGKGLVCSMSECVDLESVYKTEDCKRTCTGHKVCDHENLCQCELGWSGTNCNEPTGIPLHGISFSILLDSTLARLLLVVYIILIPVFVIRDFQLQKL